MSDNRTCSRCDQPGLAPRRSICRACVNADHRRYMSETGRKPTHNCATCGDRLVGQGRVKYCSDDCRFSNVVRCPTCGNDFATELKRIARARREGRDLVCSLKCRPKRPSVERIAVNCKHCDREMHVMPGALAQGRGKHCSKKCAALARPICGKPSKIADAAIDEFLRGAPLLCELEKRLGRWSVDLALPLHNIAVELDGEYWHNLPAMVEKDHRKDEWLNANGWNVIRIVMAKDDTPQSIARRIAEELDLCLTVAA